MKSKKVMLAFGFITGFLLLSGNDLLAGGRSAPRHITIRATSERQAIFLRQAEEATTGFRAELRRYNSLRDAYVAAVNSSSTSSSRLELLYDQLADQAEAVHDAALSIADPLSGLRQRGRQISLNQWLRDKELFGPDALDRTTLYPIAYPVHYGEDGAYWDSIDFGLGARYDNDRSGDTEDDDSNNGDRTSRQGQRRAEVPTCNVGYGDDDEENSDGEEHDHSGQEQEYSNWDHAFNALKFIAGIGAVGTEMYRGINSELNFERLLTQRKRDIRLAMSMGVDPRIFPPAIQPPYFPAWDQVSELMAALTCSNSEECAAAHQGRDGSSSRDMFQRMLRYQLMQQMFSGQGAGASSVNGTITTNRPFGNGRNGSLPFPNPDQFIRPLYDSMDNMARQLEGVGQTMGQSMGQYQSYFRQINNLAQTMAFFNQQMLPITQAMDQLRGGASLLRDRLNGLQNGLNNGFGGLQTTTQFGFQQSGSGTAFGGGSGFGSGFGGFQAPAPGGAFGAQFNGGNPGFSLGIGGNFGR